MCNWLFEAVCGEELDPLLPHFTDGTTNGHVNRVTCRSADSPRSSHKMPLHDIIVGVWCAICAVTIIGPIVFSDPKNSVGYFE